MNFQLLPDWKDVAKSSWSFKLWSAAASLLLLWQISDLVFDYPQVVERSFAMAVLIIGVLGVLARLLDQSTEQPPKGGGE
jgi:hypothetical protein